MYEKGGSVKQRNFAERGRSTVEMLSTIVIAVLLMFVALWGFRYIHDKHTVSLLIDEAVINKTRLELEADKSDQNWSSIKSKTNYTISSRYDLRGKVFMKIEGVEEGVC